MEWRRVVGGGSSLFLLLPPMSGKEKGEKHLGRDPELAMKEKKKEAD